MIKQGKHSVGHLLMEGNVVCPKAMLILLLCHPQVHPLCSNAPSGTSLACLALLGGMAARVGGARVTVGAMRVTFWGALAMGLTAGVGALSGTVA
jgi:vacuolar iron transporter family protein